MDLTTRLRGTTRLTICFLATLLLGGVLHVAYAAPASAAPLTCGRADWLYVGESPYQQKLPYNATSWKDCILQYGDGPNESVTVLQEAMKVCHGKDLTLTGEFGTATRNALRSIQSAANLEVDGVYGPDTRNEMKWLTRNVATGNNHGCRPFAYIG